jgi:hypothetical protein
MENKKCDCPKCNRDPVRKKEAYEKAVKELQKAYEEGGTIFLMTANDHTLSSFVGGNRDEMAHMLEHMAKQDKDLKMILMKVMSTISMNMMEEMIGEGGMEDLKKSIGKELDGAIAIPIKGPPPTLSKKPKAEC